MATTDPRVDAYIERAAPFAQPLLAHLRAAVHVACPDAQETIKWGMPFFLHGEHLLGHMAAFKRHADRCRGGHAARAQGPRHEGATCELPAPLADACASRVAQAIVWLGEGKSRNWKYMTR